VTVAATPRSGTPVTLRSGAYIAEIASTGASLRALTFDGRDLVVPFGLDEVRPAFRGTTLVPWPNRIAGGRYEAEGETHQLALSDPGRPNALHGLAAWLDWSIEAQDAATVTLAVEIVPQAGYPWRLRVETTYTLSDDGLTQEVRATNIGEGVAPFGTGPHPYLVAGASPLDTWTFQLPAGTVVQVDAQSIPERLESVDGSDRFDWREPRTLGAVEIDHAFTDLAAGAGGGSRARVTDPSGTGVEMTWDAECSWVQVFTGDLPGGPAQPGHRAGLAVEPMTCAPDAFNDAHYGWDTGIRRLSPRETARASWRIAAL
jgi:aldose 1-epimerase